MNEKNQKVKDALISAGIEFGSEHIYIHGDWEVKLKGERYIRLYRKGINLLKGIEATECWSYDNGDYEYEVNDFWYLIREGVDLLKGVNVTYCSVKPDGSWWYIDEEGIHNMQKDERIKSKPTELEKLKAENEKLKEEVVRLRLLNEVIEESAEQYRRVTSIEENVTEKVGKIFNELNNELNKL